MERTVYVEQRTGCMDRREAGRSSDETRMSRRWRIAPTVPRQRDLIWEKPLRAHASPVEREIRPSISVVDGVEPFEGAPRRCQREVNAPGRVAEPPGAPVPYSQMGA